MKHFSKLDNYEYEIAHSASDFEGCPKYDDITLIWRDAPCGIDVCFTKDIPPRELIGWYWGAYDFELTEGYIKDYWKKKVCDSEKPKPKPAQSIDLPIAYVHFISDCLDVIREHNLYLLLNGYDECDLDAAKSHLEEVEYSFCKELDEYGDDVTIILEA